MGESPGAQEVWQGPHVIEHHDTIEPQARCRGDTSRVGKDAHGGCDPGVDTGEAVLEHRTSPRWGAQVPGGMEKQIRGRLAVLDIVRAEDSPGETFQ